ncbi:type II toxin-antitoxin system VapC family toxin [Methylomagnum sp.]
MILLDTHAWTRWLHPELGPNLTPEVRRWIEESEDILAVSIISCLEISQLVKKGVLTLPVPLPRWFDLALNHAGIVCLPVNPTLLHASVDLPHTHKDPADRIIIATAQHYDAWLVTRDETIPKYPNVRTVWNFAPKPSYPSDSP